MFLPISQIPFSLSWRPSQIMPPGSPSLRLARNPLSHSSFSPILKLSVGLAWVPGMSLNRSPWPGKEHAGPALVLCQHLGLGDGLRFTQTIGTETQSEDEVPWMKVGKRRHWRPWIPVTKPVMESLTHRLCEPLDMISGRKCAHSLWKQSVPLWGSSEYKSL